MIRGLLNSGAMPALERMVQFTGARHRLLLHNIANISTPNFRPTDVSAKSFQKTLGEAIDRRRSQAGGLHGPLPLSDTRQMEFRPGRVDLTPRPTQDNVLFHDRNDRNLEVLMKNLAENTMAHNTALELMNNQFDMLRGAIREQA